MWGIHDKGRDSWPIPSVWEVYASTLKLRLPWGWWQGFPLRCWTCLAWVFCGRSRSQCKKSQECSVLHLSSSCNTTMASRWQAPDSLVKNFRGIHTVGIQGFYYSQHCDMSWAISESMRYSLTLISRTMLWGTSLGGDCLKASNLVCCPFVLTSLLSIGQCICDRASLAHDDNALNPMILIRTQASDLKVKQMKMWRCLRHGL